MPHAVHGIHPEQAAPHEPHLKEQHAARQGQGAVRHVPALLGKAGLPVVSKLSTLHCHYCAIMIRFGENLGEFCLEYLCLSPHCARRWVCNHVHAITNQMTHITKICFSPGVPPQRLQRASRPRGEVHIGRAARRRHGEAAALGAGVAGARVGTLPQRRALSTSRVRGAGEAHEEGACHKAAQGPCQIFKVRFNSK